MKRKKYKSFIVPDDQGEPFTRSDCKCEFCIHMHNCNVEWSSFICRTQLQKRILEVVSKLETKK